MSRMPSSNELNLENDYRLCVDAVYNAESH